MLWLAAIGLLIAGIFGVIPWLIDWPLFALAAIGASIAALLTILRVRKINGVFGTSALIGKQAVARTPLAPEGFVFVQGERWAAQIDEGSAGVGDTVTIVGAEGFQLRVHKVG